MKGIFCKHCGAWTHPAYAPVPKLTCWKCGDAIVIDTFLHLKDVVIAIDFDGTVVKNKYPDIGEDIGAAHVLQELTTCGAFLILYTMRSGLQLEDAIIWFDRHHVRLFGVNVNPTQSSWTSSTKAYAQLYIDDSALGCPLKRPPGERPYVDWKAVRQMLLTFTPANP